MVRDRIDVVIHWRPEIEILLTIGMMTFIPLGTVKSLPGILYRIRHEMCSPVQVRESMCSKIKFTVVTSPMGKTNI